MRGIPIFTFINKMDRDAQNPFDLLEEIDQVLGIETYPKMCIRDSPYDSSFTPMAYTESNIRKEGGC